MRTLVTQRWQPFRACTRSLNDFSLTSTDLSRSSRPTMPRTVDCAQRATGSTLGSGRLSVTLTQPCFAGGSWGDREGGRSSLVHSRRNLIVQEPREVTHRAKVRGGVSWRQLQRDGGPARNAPTGSCPRKPTAHRRLGW